MSAFSPYLEDKLLGVTLCGSVYTAPSTIYVGAATAVSGDAASVTEVNTGSYARQPALFNAPSSGSTANSGTLTFPEATADWGVCTHALIYDAISSGNLLYYGPFDASQNILSTYVLEIPAGALTVTLD